MKHTQSAAQRYSQLLEEAQDRLLALAGILEEHAPDGSQINWGHVGEVAHLNELLGEAIEFLNRD